MLICGHVAAADYMGVSTERISYLVKVGRLPLVSCISCPKRSRGPWPKHCFLSEDLDYYMAGAAARSFYKLRDATDDHGSS